MPEVLDDLTDLLKQATTERSHYYVASTVRRAIAEIIKLRKAKYDLENLVEDMSIQVERMFAL